MGTTQDVKNRKEEAAGLIKDTALELLRAHPSYPISPKTFSESTEINLDKAPFLFVRRDIVPRSNSESVQTVIDITVEKLTKEAQLITEVVISNLTTK